MTLPFTRDLMKDMIDAGYDISVGRCSYGHPRVKWAERQKTRYRLRIGRYCSIADRVIIYVGTQGRHAADFVSTFPLRVLHPTSIEPDPPSASVIGDLGVTIGSDVWIGREAIIMAGVTIGHGAIIGARTIVTKDVPPYAKVVGSPARNIGLRFSSDLVQELLELEWWSFPEDVIAENIDAFLTPDIAQFLREMQRVKRAASWLS